MLPEAPVCRTSGSARVGLFWARLVREMGHAWGDMVGTDKRIAEGDVCQGRQRTVRY